MLEQVIDAPVSQIQAVIRHECGQQRAREQIDEEFVGSEPLEDHEPECKRADWLVEEIQEKENLPMLTGRQIAFMVYAFFNFHDHQRGVVGMNDLLNIELVNDNLKTFDEAWENDVVGDGSRRRS